MSRGGIEARQREWIAALDAGDAEGMAALYAEDARLMPPEAGAVEGRAAIAAFFARLVAVRASVSFTSVRVHESPALCVAVGRYEMVMHPGDGAPLEGAGVFVEVWTRRAGEAWMIAEDIVTPGPRASRP